MTTQLRDYTIEPGRLDDFVDAWRRGVYPLRIGRGYRIDGAWTIPDDNRFVWVLSYDGADGWEASEASYYASPERAALDPDPAAWIVESRQWFVSEVLRPASPAAER